MKLEIIQQKMGQVVQKSQALICQTKATVQKKLEGNKMAKRMVMMLLVLFLLFASIFGYKMIKILLMPHPTPPPISVSSIHVAKEVWQSKLSSVGTVRAIYGADMTTELSGLVKKIHFKPGSSVQAGDILVQLSSDSEIAQRDALRATVELAEIVYKRDKAQFAIQAISQATLDSDRADLKMKKAQLAQQEAIVAKKLIRAPFSGFLGISAVNPGQFLNTGDKIVTLQSLDPIYVDFSLPQQNLSILKVGQKINLKTDAYPKELFPGVITTIDPKVDPATRNIQVEATIANPDLKLFPGMFGEVEVYQEDAHQNLVLPKTAISFNPYGEIIYIIHETGKDKAGKPILAVKQSFITVGESRGDQITILKGVKEGDHVVTAGQLKLKNGSLIKINNSILPDNNPNPNLKDE